MLARSIAESRRLIPYKSTDVSITNWLYNLPVRKNDKKSKDFIHEFLHLLHDIDRFGETAVAKEKKYCPKYFLMDDVDGNSMVCIFGIFLSDNNSTDPEKGIPAGCAACYVFCEDIKQFMCAARTFGNTGVHAGEPPSQAVSLLLSDVRIVSERVSRCSTMKEIEKVIFQFDWRDWRDYCRKK